MQFLLDNHHLDIERRELRRNGKMIAVEPQVFDLLVYLVQNRDRVVSKDDLIAAVWSGRIVSDSALASRINAARSAIGDSGRDQRLIRTFARRGLRYVGNVSLQAADAEVIADGAALDVSEAPRAAAPGHDRPVIAVLPFTNMSPDPEQEYFSDGITEDIITALSQLRWFLVIARNSSFVYKGKSVNLKQLGEELGVDYVLEGSVRKEGDRVRITAQLNDVESGSHIWAERYDRDLADVFAVQDEITESIVASIEPQLYAAENFRAQGKSPGCLDAWELVMRAMSHFWRLTRQDNCEAKALLEKATALDPGYGRALSLLATTHMFGAHLGWSDVRTSAPIAERAALAAILADTNDCWAHNALGSVYFSTGRLDDSLAEFEFALQLNPSFSLAHSYLGIALCYSGRWEEADVAVQRALRLSSRDPFAAIYYAIAAYAQFVGKNYNEAVRLGREAIRERTDFAGGYRVLTASAAMAGDSETAAAALQELRRAQPGISLAWVRTQLPWKRDSDREHCLEAFRRAGLT